MSDVLGNVHPQVRALRAYSLRPDRARVKLNQNENPWDTPPEIKAESLERIAELTWSRYPDFAPEKLRERLAKHVDWKADGVLVGNGSNELIQSMLMVTLGKGSRVLISEPTFALYRQVSTILGADVVSVPLSSELTFDLAALQAELHTSTPNVTILCSPNNPTGCVLSESDLEVLLESTKGLVVIDEAYFEFSDQSAVSLLQRHPNLVVLHTFSKALALAGLRVGYLLGAPELVREVAKALLPYNLNVVSQAAAEVTLEMYESKLKPLIARIRCERDRLYGELAQIPGLWPVRSLANFMVVRSSVQPARVHSELLARDILIRDVSSFPMLGDYFRVSVGTPQENDLLLAGLREIMLPKERN